MKILKGLLMMKLFKGRKKEFVILGILSFLAFWMTLSLFWTSRNYENMNINEILYVITNPLGDSGGGLVRSYILVAVIIPVILTADVLFTAYLLSGNSKYKYFKRIAMTTACVLMGLSVLYFGARSSLLSYVSNSVSTSDFVENYYVEPAETKIVFPEKKRNLIFIYLESMETSFADKASGGCLDKSLIPELTKIAVDNECFSGGGDTINGANQMPGTTWTMAGMFASSVGVPLLMQIDENGMAGKEDFFPNLRAIGDVLEEAGYRQVFQLGSNAGFGGRRPFMKDHGNFEIRDYDYSKSIGQIPNDYQVFWGYEDEKLYEFSKDTLSELAKSDQPFNLTMITVDTHFPAGYICDLCKNDNEFEYFRTISCASRQLSEFIEWLKKQSFYENTTIVITGDHLTMAGGVTEKLSEEGERKTYTCIINPDSSLQSPQKRREYSIFDLFPTTIAALGAHIEGDRLALGTNLYSSLDTVTEQVGAETELAELEKKSELLATLEKQDEKTEEIINLFASAGDPDEKTITYDENGDPQLHIVTCDLTEIEKKATIDGVSVKLWYYDRGDAVDVTYKLEPKGDGRWGADINIKSFRDADEVYYQVRAHTPGYPTTFLGRQGTLELNKD